MAKLTELKNPITAKDVNVLNPADWVSSIGYVVFAGIVAAIGMKALIKADEFLPGNNTPNYYKTATEQPAAAAGITVL